MFGRFRVVAALSLLVMNYGSAAVAQQAVDTSQNPAVGKNDSFADRLAQHIGRRFTGKPAISLTE